MAPGDHRVLWGQRCMLHNPGDISETGPPLCAKTTTTEGCACLLCEKLCKRWNLKPNQQSATTTPAGHERADWIEARLALLCVSQEPTEAFAFSLPRQDEVSSPMCTHQGLPHSPQQPPLFELAVGAVPTLVAVGASPRGVA